MKQNLEVRKLLRGQVRNIDARYVLVTLVEARVIGGVELVRYGGQDFGKPIPKTLDGVSEVITQTHIKDGSKFCLVGVPITRTLSTVPTPFEAVRPEDFAASKLLAAIRPLYPKLGDDQGKALIVATLADLRSLSTLLSVDFNACLTLSE